jgi:hypothetical protein
MPDVTRRLRCFDVRDFHEKTTQPRRPARPTRGLASRMLDGRHSWYNATRACQQKKSAPTEFRAGPRGVPGTPGGRRLVRLDNPAAPGSPNERLCWVPGFLTPLFCGKPRVPTHPLLVLRTYKANPAGSGPAERCRRSPGAERTIMSIGMLSQPHENGGRVRLVWSGPVLGVRPFCLWCLEPENEPGPDLGRLMSAPTLSPPLARGARKANRFRSSRSPPRPGHPRRRRHGDPASHLRRVGRS